MEEGLNTRDVMVVAHGHFSRVFISRWINFPLELGMGFLSRLNMNAQTLIDLQGLTLTSNLEGFVPWCYCVVHHTDSVIRLLFLATITTAWLNPRSTRSTCMQRLNKETAE